MGLELTELLRTLKQEIATLARKELNTLVSSATKDGLAILDRLQGDLERWTQQLSAGDLSPDDFKDLVMGQKDEVELTALKQAGLAAIAADRFKDSVFNLITNTVIGLFI